MSDAWGPRFALRVEELQEASNGPDLQVGGQVLERMSEGWTLKVANFNGRVWLVKDGQREEVDVEDFYNLLAEGSITPAKMGLFYNEHFLSPPQELERKAA